MKSQPSALSWRAVSIVSSMLTPPSTHSTQESRMPIALPAGQTRRQASNTSSGKRRRLSAVPPYSSLRWLLMGDRNWLQQIAVRAVQLDDVEAQPQRCAGWPRRRPA